MEQETNNSIYTITDQDVITMAPVVDLLIGKTQFLWDKYNNEEDLDKKKEFYRALEQVTNQLKIFSNLGFRPSEEPIEEGERQIEITVEDLNKYGSEIEALKHNEVFLSLTKEEQDDLIENIIANQGDKFLGY